MMVVVGLVVRKTVVIGVMMMNPPRVAELHQTWQQKQPHPQHHHYLCFLLLLLAPMMKGVAYLLLPRGPPVVARWRPFIFPKKLLTWREIFFFLFHDDDRGGGVGGSGVRQRGWGCCCLMLPLPPVVCN